MALSRELRPGGWLQVRLLGRNWTLTRDGDTLSAAPPAFGVRERLGVIWLAPAEPAAELLDVPEAADRRFVLGWMEPVRSPGLRDRWPTRSSTPRTSPSSTPPPSGRRTRRRSSRRRSRPNRAASAACRSSGATTRSTRRSPRAGGRCGSAGGRRTPTGLPFQLRLRQEFLDSGATTTILYLLQPEDLDSTRIYVCLLLSSGPGQPLHTPAEVAAELALQKQILEEDVRSQATLAVPGLPLDLRAEVHVPADRLGVALRHALGDFMAVGRRQEAAA